MFEEKIRTQLQKSDWLLFLRVLFWPMGDLISRFKFMTQNRFELWSPEQISTFSPFKKEKKKEINQQNQQNKTLHNLGILIPIIQSHIKNNKY